VELVRIGSTLSLYLGGTFKGSQSGVTSGGGKHKIFGAYLNSRRTTTVFYTQVDITEFMFLQEA